MIKRTFQLNNEISVEDDGTSIKLLLSKETGQRGETTTNLTINLKDKVGEFIEILQEANNRKKRKHPGKKRETKKKHKN